MWEIPQGDLGTIDGEEYSSVELQHLISDWICRKHDDARESDDGITLKKVLMYVTRTQNGKPELLVFEHRDQPAAGLQVPAGTIEAGEAAVTAAWRELHEES